MLEYLFRFYRWLLMLFGFGDPLIFYYGCPNSKRAKKLQIKKQLLK